MVLRRLLSLLFILLLVTACGRRLPDETETTSTDRGAVAAESVNDADNADIAEVQGEEIDVVEADDTTDSDVSDSEAESDTEVADEATESGTDTVETTNDTETATDDTTDEEEVVEVAAAPADELITLVANASPSAGETLFNEQSATGFACVTCHNVENEVRLVGPGLWNIPARAENRIEGQVAERYLYNSILHPNDYIVEGYPQMVMPGNYEEIYSEDEVLNLVAYLMTLGEQPERDMAAQSATTEDETQQTTSDEATNEETATEVVEPEPTEDVVADADDSAEPTEEPVVDEATTEEPVAEATPEPTDEVAEVEPTVEPTAEPVEVADTDTESETTTESDDVVVVTQIVVITATPQEVAMAATEPAATPDPNATPDFVVTLASYGRVDSGETLYNDNCIACHSVDGSGTGDSIDLSNVSALSGAVAPERYLLDALSNAEAHTNIAGSYVDVLSNIELYDLIAYIVSLTSE